MTMKNIGRPHFLASTSTRIDQRAIAFDQLALLHHLGKLFVPILFDGVVMVVIGEGALLHLPKVQFEAADRDPGELSEARRKLRLEVAEGTEKSAAERDLSIRSVPTPMVGIVSYSEISLTTLAGAASNSSMKQPAPSSANASSTIFIAVSAVRP